MKHPAMHHDEGRVDSIAQGSHRAVGNWHCAGLLKIGPGVSQSVLRVEAQGGNVLSTLWSASRLLGTWGLVSVFFFHEAMGEMHREAASWRSDWGLSMISKAVSSAAREKERSRQPKDACRETQLQQCTTEHCARRGLLQTAPSVIGQWN
jgi:hypothetical protein